VLGELTVVLNRLPTGLQAAQELGVWQATLYEQASRLERACGGRLVNRRPQRPGTGILTSLGEQLCQQAREHLGIPAAQHAHSSP
jgi:DNA-binding transcriptional LysR family regulator